MKLSCIASLSDKFSCDFCGRRFVYKKMIRRHMITHEEGVKCNLCSKKVKWCYMKSHIKLLHAPSRGLQCRNCKMSFKDKDSLKNHKIIHKKFECADCGKEMTRKSNFKRHVELHKNPAKLQCKICFKKLSCKVSLKIHLRLHERKNLLIKDWIQCGQCSMKLKNKLKLAKHCWKKHNEMMDRED